MEKQPTSTGGARFFDEPIKDAALSSESLHREYDGTVFNGINAVQVQLDDQGEVVRIDSFFTSTGKKSVPFVRGETGGWKGEGGFYGDSTVMGQRLDAVVKATKADWQMWKETETQHPGVDFRTWKAQRVDAMAEEYRRLKGESNS
ncbi:hypothetical protein GYA19_02430 [Candidatus Beckwithbacteria bacterium]|nr:hypothetical protein [Candidatus Beckwithbacteria bacterium]